MAIVLADLSPIGTPYTHTPLLWKGRLSSSSSSVEEEAEEEEEEEGALVDQDREAIECDDEDVVEGDVWAASQLIQGAWMDGVHVHIQHTNSPQYTLPHSTPYLYKHTNTQTH